MTGYLRFMLARLLRDESAMARHSITGTELLAGLAGKSVALVGNARALPHADQGQQIDSHDLVARINRAPMPDKASHGSRTDWLFLATSITRDHLDSLDPAQVLWMSHKRKRLPWRIASGEGFYLHPLPGYEALKRQLGAPPSTGIMATELLLRSDLDRLDLYGFDGFASLSLSGRRNAAQVPHHFATEAAWLQSRAATDPRLTINPPQQV